MDITITLTTKQAQVLQEASLAVHGKPAREAVTDYMRFTVREYRTRQQQAGVDALIISDEWGTL